MNTLVSRSQAAALCGTTPDTFSAWVKRGIMPPRISGTSKWSLAAIQAKIDPPKPAPTPVSAKASLEERFAKWSRKSK